MGTKELRTKRLHLRRHRIGDAALLWKNIGCDREMFQYTGWNPYDSMEQAERTIRSFIGRYGDPHFYSWAAERENELIGVIGAYDYNEEKDSIEVGLSIAKAFWGQGFGSEALKAVLLFLTETEKIRTVTAWCAGENIGSRRVMEKSGMVLTGIEPGALRVGDSRMDRWDFCYNAE